MLGRDVRVAVESSEGSTLKDMGEATTTSDDTPSVAAAGIGLRKSVLAEALTTAPVEAAVDRATKTAMRRCSMLLEAWLRWRRPSSGSVDCTPIGSGTPTVLTLIATSASVTLGSAAASTCTKAVPLNWDAGESTRRVKLTKFMNASPGLSGGAGGAGGGGGGRGGHGGGGDFNTGGSDTVTGGNPTEMGGGGEMVTGGTPTEMGGGGAMAMGGTPTEMGGGGEAGKTGRGGGGERARKRWRR